MNPSEGELETACSKSPDGKHCVHWYDEPGAPCCYCEGPELQARLTATLEEGERKRADGHDHYRMTRDSVGEGER